MGTNRRSVMTLFSDPACPFCHRVRIVLAEKGIAVEVVDVDAQNLPEEVMDFNPYGTVPTLVDRDLRLWESRIIMEYLDERFPHPPLMPVDPIARANARLFMYRVDQDWYQLMGRILKGTQDADIAQARKELRESLIVTSPVFGAKPYFMSDEFSLVDCCKVRPKTGGRPACPQFSCLGKKTGPGKHGAIRRTRLLWVCPDTGCSGQQTVTVGHKSKEVPAPNWINTVLGNLKASSSACNTSIPKDCTAPASPFQGLDAQPFKVKGYSPLTDSTQIHITR